MDEAHAVARTLADVHGQVGQVHAHVGRAAGLVLTDLGGHKTADVVLCLLRGPADVRGENDVVEGGQGRGEGVAVGARFLGEHVDGRAAQVARDQCGVQGIHVDDVSAREVDEQGAGLHELELASPDEVGVGLLAVHVHGDDIGLA